MARAALCVAATLFLLNREILPLDGVPASGPGSDHGLLTWNIWWATESLEQGRNPYRTDLLYHPLGSGLASHTLAPGFAPVGLLTKLARGGARDYPLFGLRLSIALCISLGMGLAWTAFREMGATSLAAFGAALGWAFSATFHSLAGNPTLAAACFLLPAAALATLALLREPSPVRAAVLGALASGSVYFSEYFAPFMIVALGVAFLASLTVSDAREAVFATIRRLGTRGISVSVLAGLLTIAPFLLNWWPPAVRAPSERQIRAGGANLAALVVPAPGITPIYSLQPIRRLQARITRAGGAFLGYPTLLFAALGAVRVPRAARRVLLALAALFLVLALGTHLRVFGTHTLIPLPYDLLRLVPPFGLARDPERLAVFASFALLALAALGVTAAAAAAARRRPGLGLLVSVGACAWWAAEGVHPRPRTGPYAAPAELLSLPAGAVANLPLSTTDGLAMFLQVFHHRPIVTGYVSRATPDQFDHVRALQELLDADPEAFARELRRLGVATVIVRRDLPAGAAEALQGQLTLLDLRR